MKISVMKLIRFLSILIILINFNLIYGQSQKNDSINSSLDSIYQTDQNIRFKLIDLQKKDEMQPEELKNIIVKMNKIDSVNLNKIKSLIDNYGWPENLSFQRNQTIFLVIQHSDLGTQQQYLPIIQKAVEEGKTLPSNLAILEDRISLREGKKQIYGSQIFVDSKTGKKYVEPLKNPETVDKRRAKVGLPTMNEYLKQTNQMEWSIEKYYKDLPEIEKLLKKYHKIN